MHCCDIITLFPLCSSYSLFATGIIAMCRNKYLADCPREKGGRAPKNTKFDSTFGFLFIYLPSHKQAARTKNDQRKKILQNVHLSSPKLPSSFLEKEESIQSISDASSPNQTRIFMFTLHKLPNDATIWQAKEGVWVGSLGIRFIRSSEVGRGIRVLSHLTGFYYCRSIGSVAA